MWPVRRELRSFKTAARAGEVVHNTPMEREPTANAIRNETPRRSGYTNEDNMEMEMNPLMSTPHASASSNTPFGKVIDSSRPVTRSARQGYFDSILVGSPSTQSQAQDRLRLATTGDGAPSMVASHLEEARDIDYGPIGGGGGESLDEELGPNEDQTTSAEPQPDRLEKNHPTVGGLRIPRRSDRIRAQTGTAREPPLSTVLSAASCSSNRIQKRRKKAPIKAGVVITSVRRSARLAKPLDIFHKYPDLPPELKMMIWEAAIEPRLAYICNRSSILGHAHNFGIQNRIPPWFMACDLSMYIAKRHYQKLFGQNGMGIYPSIGIPLCHQDINPSVDIVIFEPCHSGCRAFYCAQQYSQADRAAVRKLAVQIDSPHLLPTSEPGWVTISRSWPNVEMLFMTKPAVKGLDRSDKAMIRIKEGDHEQALRKQFGEWKKGDGRDHKLTTLEFVRVVERESQSKNAKDRYQSVEDRKTGLIEDIVLG